MNIRFIWEKVVYPQPLKGSICTQSFKVRRETADVKHETRVLETIQKQSPRVLVSQGLCNTVIIGEASCARLAPL